MQKKKAGSSLVLGIGKFWPTGVSVHGIYLDHAPAGLSYEGLKKARRDQLVTTSAQGLFSLLAIASDLAGRPVDVREILVLKEVEL